MKESPRRGGDGGEAEGLLRRSLPGGQAMVVAAGRPTYRGQHEACGGAFPHARTLRVGRGGSSTSFSETYQNLSTSSPQQQTQNAEWQRPRCTPRALLLPPGIATAREIKPVWSRRYGLTVAMESPCGGSDEGISIPWHTAPTCTAAETPRHRGATAGHTLELGPRMRIHPRDRGAFCHSAPTYGLQGSVGVLRYV